jgi:hypothetical protein
MPTRPPQHLDFDADDTLWARYGYGTKVFELTLEETVRRLHDGILPAVAAGLRAVFIAHPHTWRLEVVALPENDARILRVTRFRELATLF